MNYVVGEQFEREWNRLRDKLDRANGSGVDNSTHTLTVSPQQQAKQPHSPNEIVELKITGSINNGQYTAQTFYGPSNCKPSSTLVESDLGVLNASQIVEVWNLGEIAASSAGFSSGQYVLGILKGYNFNTSRPIYHVGSAGGGGVGKGQYQSMVYQMVAQNSAGWDWVRAHGLIG